ncbi:T9SS type A sorting domain-containing protein [Aureispira sp. CCB-E]|uniref:T9SS type A sorting domain-containing protein n=1 Tax=Aureispira sp. CCB-E TaxID=3051121 RepID=UPI0028692703|nr:T9SS type A sorting domain-containing protein [Aureispira sp. CCB-E]WMX12759.1 T9SS type A sorting domain-containing protein [Aureispira sp. CCB-E]
MKVFFTTCVLFFVACSFTRAQTVLLETFNGTSTPSGWTNTATAGPGWLFSTNAGYDVSSITDHTNNGGNYAWIDFSGTDAGVVLQSPVIDVSTLTTPYLQFYYESHYSGSLSPFNFVYLEAWNGSSWVLVNTFQGNTPFGWDEYGFNMSSFTFNGGNDLQFRFRGESGGASNDFNNDLLLDDVEVMELPTCPKPSNLAVNNITATSADFSWVENGTATDWQVEFGPQGFTQGTTAGTVVFTSTNPYSQTGLSPSTTFDLYVRSICAPGDTSRWVGPINFTTLCATAVAPWSESFTGNSTPNCWNESGSEPWRYSTSAGYAAANAGDHTGNGGNYAWIDGSSPSGPNQISTLESPPIDVSGLTVPLLSYWVFSHNPTDNSYNTLTVEVYDGAAWNIVSTINSDQGNGWNHIIAGLQNLTITGPIQIRFTIAENSPGTAFYNDILIDDIEVKEAPNVSADTLLGVQSLYCNAAVNVTLVVSNKSGNPETDVPWTVESNGTVIANGVIPVLAPNGSDSIPLSLGGVGPAGPNAMITAYTHFAPDQTSSDDTLIVTTGMSYTGVNATMTSPVGCAGASNGEIEAVGNNGIGAYTYQWDASAGSQTTATATGLSAGMYTLTVTDSIGCSTVASLTLVDPPAMTLTSSGTDLNCNGDNSGAAVATPNGGVPGYTYMWSNGAMTNQLANVAAGTYTVSVTDANGCELTSTVTLNEPATAILASVTDNGNGTALANATGGVAPYSYQWDASTGNQTTAMATGLTPGNVYYVVVTDANGCSDVVSFKAIALDVTTIDDDANLSMYPNPTSGNVFVDLNLNEQMDVQIQIATVTGQVLMTHQFNQTQNSKFELETAQLPTGVYMVTFSIGSDQLTKKLIVTK